jgi:two-component system response regulator HydG
VWKEVLEMPEKKIVVVDDDENIRKTFCLIFKKNYRVYAAKDAEEALRLFKNLKFDLIIADYRLPQLSGIELVGRLREMGYRGEAILITAHSDLITIEELGRYSIGHFFAKPLDFNSLTRSIDFLLLPREAFDKTV